MIIGTNSNGGLGWGIGNGWTCGTCGTYVPSGVTHHCSGGAAWTLMSDWTTIYLGQIVGLLNQLVELHQPMTLDVQIAEVQDEEFARKIAEEVKRLCVTPEEAREALDEPYITTFRIAEESAPETFDLIELPPAVIEQLYGSWSWARQRQTTTERDLKEAHENLLKMRQRHLDTLTDGAEVGQTLRRAGVEPEERWAREQEEKANGDA